MFAFSLIPRSFLEILARRMMAAAFSSSTSSTRVKHHAVLDVADLVDRLVLGGEVVDVPGQRGGGLR